MATPMYQRFSKLLSYMQDKNINRFNLITDLENKPEVGSRAT